METKITIITLMILSFSSNRHLQSQILVRENGSISMQEYSTDKNKGLQIYPDGIYYFNTKQTQANHLVTVATPGSLTGKCWLVTAPGNKNSHRFYVNGEGIVYKYGSFIMADYGGGNGDVMNGSGDILDGISGRYYTTYSEVDTRNGNRKISVSAQEVEKVLPEAVTRDENDMLYVDYNALTVVLIEAYKEQKAEIERLRKTLEEHGLLEPEK